jgi:hypothetical protein
MDNARKECVMNELEAFAKAALPAVIAPVAGGRLVTDPGLAQELAKAAYIVAAAMAAESRRWELDESGKYMRK